ncbi:Metal-dependent hydrolase [Abortiporus biennis]
MPSRVLSIRGVHLPYTDGELARKRFTVICVDDKVDSIVEFEAESVDEVSSEEDIEQEVIHVEEPCLLLPSFCHAHIHLDKCFLLSTGKCDELVTGDFEEALQVTAKAKSSFRDNREDLLERGRRLIVESVECGVSGMRAHVEVDDIVDMTCLSVGLQLKEEMKSVCDIQVAAFAQDPLFLRESVNPGRNYSLLAQACAEYPIQAVGSAPYVEATIEDAKKNIALLFDLACKYKIHLDFHLDYNVDPHSEPMIWEVVNILLDKKQKNQWAAEKCVCIGHATRLTLFSDEEWTKLSNIIRGNDLPISFVGLPQSDMYMMGRGREIPIRTTLNIPKLSSKYQLPFAMSVNNVDNAFTPQGSMDPLSLCTLGVALFHTCTVVDCACMLQSISTIARYAIGMESSSRTLVPTSNDTANFVLLHGVQKISSAARSSPSFERTTVFQGRKVAERIGRKWFTLN